MPRHIGSDGFQDGIPGICPECFSEQTQTPRPKHYYCKHRERLTSKRSDTRSFARCASRRLRDSPPICSMDRPAGDGKVDVGDNNLPDALVHPGCF